MTYNRPENHWSGPPHPDVVTRGAGHAQALKHYTDMAEQAALRVRVAELEQALTNLLGGIYLHDEDGLSEHADCVVNARAILTKAVQS